MEKLGQKLLLLSLNYTTCIAFYMYLTIFFNKNTNYIGTYYFYLAQNRMHCPWIYIQRKQQKALIHT